jgi:hypothetical protein
MSTPHEQAPVHPELLADALQARELLIGLIGLLRHPHRVAAVAAARGVALEARAAADRVVDQLEAQQVMAHEDAARARDAAAKGGQ